MKTLLTATAFFSLFLFAGCNMEINNGGNLAFYDVLTIQEDKDNPGTYYCMQDGGGWVISHDVSLKGVQRGTFDVYYTKDDWVIQGKGKSYINNAHLVVNNEYKIFYPSQENFLPSLENKESPDVNRLSAGYLDIDLKGLSVFVDGNGSPTNIKLIYDETQQYPDTLNLQFYYTPDSNGGTHLTSSVGTSDLTLSCDLSSLLDKREWKDSIFVKINRGVNQQIRWTKIKKTDLEKPNFKILKIVPD